MLVACIVRYDIDAYAEFQSGPATTDKDIDCTRVTTDGLLDGYDIGEVIQVPMDDPTVSLEVSIAARGMKHPAKGKRRQIGLSAIIGALPATCEHLTHVVDAYFIQARSNFTERLGEGHDLDRRRIKAIAEFADLGARKGARHGPTAVLESGG
jgi:hypothetical protein